MKRTKRKGPLFDSFTNPPASPYWLGNPRPESNPNLPHGRVWAPHEGRHARLRRLRQLCRDVLSSKDPQVIAMLERIKILVASAEEPEYGLLHIISVAKSMTDDTGMPWLEMVDYIVDKAEQELREKENGQAKS